MSDQKLYKNALTGHIVSGGKHMADYARSHQHIFECDAQGNPVHVVHAPPPPAAEITEYPEGNRPKPVRVDDASTGAEGKVLDRATRVSLLAQAIGQLEPGNPDHWTTTGLPRVEALEAETELEDVNMAERDEAFEMFKGE